MLKRNKLFPLLLGSIYLFISCNGATDKPAKESDGSFTSPPGYDLAAGTVLKLPQELDEISGVFYYPKDSSVFCINDERGFLYKVFLDESKDLQKWKFSRKGDFEDLILVDSTFYVLQSSGNLLKFKFFSGDSITIDTITMPLKGKNEFEILYYNKASNRMILVCKECEEDNKAKVSAIAYDHTSNTTSTAYELPAKEIEKKLGEKGRFKASAAGIHPVTNDLYIISSVNKCLVICETNGKVKEVYKLDPKLFKQPEGLTFTSQGDMIISNESADQGAANIMFYKYKSSGQ